MKSEEHQQALEEHIRNLAQAIDNGIKENQRNIAYNVSLGAVELFALYLHTLHLIEGSGDQWDHRIFKSKKRVMEKVPFAFPDKERILKLLEEIEQERNLLCYGKRQPQQRIERMIANFQELRRTIDQHLPHEPTK
ncbi:MAG TPA: hypothetical protein VJI32_07490 [Candidatus Nanoarchaeia archaeon]|nr:MAG: hypothetical protein QT02_C0003G0049 [archaeon GW2011_AR9]MBS3120974.1 hypothetical protein [Candidatus Woesearchaeota archaeon]HIG93342.1 hypothetical protein [Candidatus Woesearchaeota archaeon]HIH13569.1 hypothetical protein [Candidatus Woesearchaeota archaeon]HLC71828.1 hypothetical protein [Candidatus Nanoarchaeia archaeon]